MDTHTDSKTQRHTQTQRHKTKTLNIKEWKRNTPCKPIIGRLEVLKLNQTKYNSRQKNTDTCKKDVSQ